MTHLLKYLAMPLAFVVAVVLFASPSAPASFGLVGGSAFAQYDDEEPPCETTSWCIPPPPPIPETPPPEPEPEPEPAPEDDYDCELVRGFDGGLWPIGRDCPTVFDYIDWTMVCAAIAGTLAARGFGPAAGVLGSYCYILDRSTS